MALKSIFVKDTRIIISWEEQFAKIQLVYNDLMAPYKTIVEHWPSFESLKEYFKDENASYAAIMPSQFTVAMAKVEEIKAEYEKSKKMCFIIDDKVKELQIQSAPSDGYIVHYILSGTELIRKLPDNSTETEDGWTVWKSKLWNLPKLSSKELAGFKRDKITKAELIKFLKEDLPKYIDAGLDIECDLSLSDEPATNIQIGNVTRDHVELVTSWAVPLDSIDPEFDLSGYVLSGRTVYSGINPIEIEEYCPNLVGKNILAYNTIAEFLDTTYLKWKPWITGNIEQFEEMHHWLKPPYNTFLKIETSYKDGIGQTFAKTYALIDNECLSATVLQQALSSPYFHLSNGWVKSVDLKSDTNLQNVDFTMSTFRLNSKQILHLGSKELADKCQDILFVNPTQWTASGLKADIASAHLSYLTKWGINGGISGGYEYFMAYGLPYIIPFIQENPGKVLIVSESKYQYSLKTVIRSIPVLSDPQAMIITYSDLNLLAHRKFNIGIFIEPEEAFQSLSMTNDIANMMNECNISFFFTKKDFLNLTIEEREAISQLLASENSNDLDYLIRNINETLIAPAKTSFAKNLNLETTPLIYHEQSVNPN